MTQKKDYEIPVTVKLVRADSTGYQSTRTFRRKPGAKALLLFAIRQAVERIVLYNIEEFEYLNIIIADKVVLSLDLTNFEDLSDQLTDLFI